MKQMLKGNIKKRSLLLFLFLLGFSTYLLRQGEKLNTVEASSIITKGDFSLNVDNKWDAEGKKSYAYLKWDDVKDLSKDGYQLYQSEDGISWNARSLNYGKSIKVLNVYPDISASNTLASWMNGLGLKDEAGNNLIQVTAVTISQFNSNPNYYLKNTTGDYQYDVVMFGSWDSNNQNRDLNSQSFVATQQFIDSGRGVLFGHDTTNQKVFSGFNKSLGLTIEKPVGAPGDIRTGGAKIQVKNDGYLMKYPFEMANKQVLTIPPSHNSSLASKSIGTNWIMFEPPFTLFNLNKWEDSQWTTAWYLKTNGNIGMIQTGHSQGASTLDERKIIANTLYNLAQVSLDTSANDQTVKDNQAPQLATAKQKAGGTVESFDIEINSIDNGKEYQWYVEANTKSSGIKKSDVVKEAITSNIAGYFYTIDSSATSSLNTTVEGKKDSFGRIDASKYDIYVAPTGTTNTTDPNYDPTKDSSLVTYDTTGTITDINGIRALNQYLHIVSVDRANNVSGVKTIKIKDIMTQFKLTEKYQYQDADGQLQDLQPAATFDLKKGTNYSKLAPTMPDNWEASSYKIDHGAAIQDKTAKINDVSNHHTVTFIYKKAISTVHLRQVILGAEPSLVVPSSGYIDLLQQDTLLHAKAPSGTKDDLVFTPIKLEMLPGYFTYQINPSMPEYYRYRGYLLTDKLHTIGTRVDDETLPVLDFSKKKEYWLTIYLEPTTSSPKAYSWMYQTEKLGQVK